MAVLDVQNLTLSFGERTLFAGVSFSIKEREKVGFVGANGVGKTSLFKVICGDYTPDSGGAFLSKNCKLGYMEQHTCSAGNTVWNELVSVFAPLMELERQLEEVGDRLRSGQGDTAADIALQDRLTEQFQREGGLTYKSMTRSALLGLGFTGAMIAWLILPGIYHGLPSLPLTVAALAVCTLVSLLLLNPPSPKTWAAMLSTLAGVALAGGVFYLFSTLLHLSGMNDTNGEGLVLVAGQTGLELHWLLLVAVLISSLGAVMDVALSLASSLHELREADGKMSGLQLFAAGMRIGRDMIGTMSNTLILAFAGEAVTTLLLLMAYGWHSSQLFASDYAAIQVAQGVASTLGVVLGVPITSGICAALYRPLKR